MFLTIAYACACLLLGLVGTNRKFGFWGYFFCSLFLTPLVGALVLLGSDPRPRPKLQETCPHCSYPLPRRRV